MNDKLFIPLYIDKVKLFDINSIICGGFSEFNEINVSSDNNITTDFKTGAGFNLFKLNANVETGMKDSDLKKVTGNAKYIQTSSSMLSNLYSELEKKIKSIDSAKSGDFVELELCFNLNSILAFLTDCKVLIDFGNQALKLSENKDGKELKNTIKIIDSLINLIDNKSNVVEIVAEDDKYVYVTYLNMDYLYHTQLERIDGQELKYLAQVINIVDNYNFCNDTVLSKFSPNLIDEFITSIKSISTQDFFSKNMQLKTDAGGKKVVLLDVISICRRES